MLLRRYRRLLALAGLVSAFGEGSPQAIRARNNLALAQVSLGDYRSALPQLRRTLALLLKEHDEADPSCINVLSNVAYCTHLMEDLDGALPLYRKAVALCQRRRRFTAD